MPGTELKGSEQRLIFEGTPFCWPGRETKGKPAILWGGSSKNDTQVGVEQYSIGNLFHLVLKVIFLVVSLMVIPCKKNWLINFHIVAHATGNPRRIFRDSQALSTGHIAQGHCRGISFLPSDEVLTSAAWRHRIHRDQLKEKIYKPPTETPVMAS